MQAFLPAAVNCLTVKAILYRITGLYVLSIPGFRLVQGRFFDAGLKTNAVAVTAARIERHVPRGVLQGINTGGRTEKLCSRLPEKYAGNVCGDNSIIWVEMLYVPPPGGGGCMGCLQGNHGFTAAEIRVDVVCDKAGFEIPGIAQRLS